MEKSEIQKLQREVNEKIKKRNSCFLDLVKNLLNEIGEKYECDSYKITTKHLFITYTGVYLNDTKMLIHANDFCNIETTLYFLKVKLNEFAIRKELEEMEKIKKQNTQKNVDPNLKNFLVELAVKNMGLDQLNGQMSVGDCFIIYKVIEIEFTPYSIIFSTDYKKVFPYIKATFPNTDTSEAVKHFMRISQQISPFPITI